MVAERGRSDRPLEERKSPLVPLLPWLAIAWLAVYWLMYFSSPLPNSQREDLSTRYDIVQSLPGFYLEWLLPSGPARPGSGWEMFPQRFDLILCGGFLLLTAIALGRLALRALHLKQITDQASEAALSSGLGLSLLSLITLGFGWFGLLFRWLFLGMFVGVLLLEGVLTGLTWRRQRGSAGASPSRGNRTITNSPKSAHWGLVTLCLIVMAPFVICMFLGSMLPPVDFDVREYHLQGPKEYFQDGRVHLLPHNVYTSFPFLTEMLSLAGMVIRGDWFRGALIGKLVLMSFAPITALGVFCVARRIAGSTAAWLASLIYLTTPWTYRISIIAYTEGAFCCYVILTVLAFWVWLENSRGDGTTNEQSAINPWWRRPDSLSFRVSILVGLIAGSDASTKYPGVPFVVIPAGFALLIAAYFRSDHSLRRSILTGVFFSIGVLIAFGPWMLKNLIETGNPVYPLLYSVFGGVDWNEQLNQKWKAAHSTTAANFWNVRSDFAGVMLRNDWLSPLLFGLAPLALMNWNRRAVLAVAGCGLLFLTGWFFLTHRIDRFWVPVIPLVAVLSGCGLLALWSSRRGPAQPAEPRPLLVRVITIGLVCFAVSYNFAFVASGLSGDNRYLSDIDLARSRTKNWAVSIIDQLKLPDDARVLFVGEAEVFDANFPLAYNTVFDVSLLEEWTSTKTDEKTWEMLPAEQSLEKLRSRGITHVLVNWNEILRYRTTYGYTDFVAPSRMQELVDMGVLEPLPLPAAWSEREFDDLPVSWKSQVLRWGPELRVGADRENLREYDLYRVSPE